MNTISSEYCIFLFLTIIFLLSIQEVSDAADIINASQIFTDNGTTLVSSAERFELGFFSPDNKNRYVGIWYKNIPGRTVVWVANNDNPLTETSGVLRVVEPGILVLLDGNGSTVWSSNTSTNVQNPVAQLLNTGNLVVKDGNDDNQDNYLWQSFNYPTDTFLPGMKIGWNFRTGLEVYLTSRKSNDDPASGEFTYRCDPNGYPQTIVKKGEDVVYRSGLWYYVDYSPVLNLQIGNIFQFGLVMNENEVYFNYVIRNESVRARYTLNGSIGQTWIWAQSWINYLNVPVDHCGDYNKCGPHGVCNIQKDPVCGCLDRFIPKDPQAWERGNWSDGCIRSTPLNTNCLNGYGFSRYSAVKLPDARHSWFNNSMTLEECGVLCSNNCSCTAYTTLNTSRTETGCLHWSGDLVDIREVSPGQDIYIRMASSDSENSRDSGQRNRKILIVTFSLVTGMLVLCLSLLFYARRRKKLDQQRQTDVAGMLRPNHTDNHPDQTHEDLELPLFDLFTITKATHHFSFNNKLGEGLLANGQEIAVKRLSRTSLQGVDELKNEVICIAKLQHRNLVKLLGWCNQGEEMMLVYEYMANKSLDLILFDPTKSKLLNWPRRFNIINGIARGLLYLHQDSRLRVIHRDLKASNILLDSDMSPKISDFGLARTFGGNETEANTNRIVGTYGYMSPEYAVDGLFSVKSDVFSYGVIVLEVITGKKNRGFSHTDHLLNLLGHAWMLYREHRSLELLDPCIRNSCNITEVLRSIHIGLLCVQERPEDRPSMSSVVQMLSNDGVLPEAKRPGFFTTRDVHNTELSVSSNTASSTNTMSVTLPVGR